MSRRAARPLLRVLLVDDSRLQRAGWALLLGSQRDLEVVAEASGGEEALAVLRETAVDVVLMDAQMPGLDGVATTAALTADEEVAARGIPAVVLVATSDIDARVADAAIAGAFAVMFKDTEPEALFTALRDAASSRGLS